MDWDIVEMEVMMKKDVHVPAALELAWYLCKFGFACLFILLFPKKTKKRKSEKEICVIRGCGENREGTASKKVESP